MFPYEDIKVEQSNVSKINTPRDLGFSHHCWSGHEEGGIVRQDFSKTCMLDVFM